MPVYRYTCPSCGATIEQRVAVEDRHRLAPICKCDSAMELTILPAGMSFKGQGWTPKFGPL